jgi:hypothetical protein
MNEELLPVKRGTYEVEDDHVALNGVRRRRCAGFNRAGEPCRSYAVRESDLCRVHLAMSEGRPTFGNLSTKQAGERSGLVRRSRVQLRQMLVPSGRITPRTLLKAEVVRNGSALAQRVVASALDESTGVKGATLGLRLIDAVDPQAEATFSMDVSSLTLEDVDNMPYGDFIRLCEHLGMDTGDLPAPRD